MGSIFLGKKTKTLLDHPLPIVLAKKSGPQSDRKNFMIHHLNCKASCIRNANNHRVFGLNTPTLGSLPRDLPDSATTLTPTTHLLTGPESCPYPAPGFIGWLDMSLQPGLNEKPRLPHFINAKICQEQLVQSPCPSSNFIITPSSVTCLMITSLPITLL